MLLLVLMDHGLQKLNTNGEFYALTCIDTTTNLVELTCSDTKSSDAIARKFEQTWLAWNLRPLRIGHNNHPKLG